MKRLLKINRIVSQNYWTNYLGLARSLFALGTLCTLLFNDYKTLFYAGLLNENKLDLHHVTFNLYSWFPDLTYGYWISIFVLVVTIIGIYPRFTCIPHWLVTYSFFTTSMIGDGGDQVATILTLLIIPICLLDKRNSHWKSTSLSQSFYSKCLATASYQLIRLQIFVVYFFAAVGKFSSDEWREGTALYYWLKEPLFGAEVIYQPILDFIFQSDIATAFLTWSVLLFELFLAWAYFAKEPKIKKLALVSGVVFHFGIVLMFGLVSFFLSMSGALILYLISKNNNYEYRNLDINNYVGRIINLLFFSPKKKKSSIRLPNQTFYEES